MNSSRIGRTLAALALAVGLTFAVAAPAHAACGDTTAQWVGTTGSVWSGTMDGSTAFTATFLPPVLGVQLATTVIVPQSGVGTWVHDYDFRWGSTLAGVWEHHFEVTPSTCSGSTVTEAAGGMTDQNAVVHYLTMTRTL